MIAQPAELPAIQAAARLSERQRLASQSEPVSLPQILGQFRSMVDRAMGEAGLYAPEHAAIALKQTEGDIAEAASILRAHRQSLERRYTSRIVDTEGMQVLRRISSAFREIPGGQILGPTYDYSQRLIDEGLAFEDEDAIRCKLDAVEQGVRSDPDEPFPRSYSKVVSLLKTQDLIRPANEGEDKQVVDLTRQPLLYPAPRSGALQTLARGETGAMMALGYSAMRGQGGDHPTIGELRVGYVTATVTDGRGRARYLGRIKVTESENISKIKTLKKDPVPYMSLGYGLCFGQNETKAICMGILDRSMRLPGDAAPAVSQEFVLHHVEGPDAYGYVNSLKLPEYVDFQRELHDLRAAVHRSSDRQEARENTRIQA